MTDFLSSPLLFPSDLDDSFLLADPTFKLPAPVNWTDFTYFTMMTDTLAPRTVDTDIHTIVSFLNDTNATTTTLVLLETDPADDPGATKSKLDQFIHYALHLARIEPKMNGGLCHDDTDNEQYSFPEMVYGALEKDSQHKPYGSHLTMHHEQDNGERPQWLVCDDTIDTPDLVYSASSPAQSLAFQDSIASLADNPSSLNARAKWIIKANKVKQNCVKSLSSPARKLGPLVL